MQSNVVLITLKYLGKRCQTYYKSGVLFIWFNDSKATRNYCIFGKIKNKTAFYATSILLNVLESYLYLLCEV